MPIPFAVLAVLLLVPSVLRVPGERDLSTGLNEEDGDREDSVNTIIALDLGCPERLPLRSPLCLEQR